LLTVKKAEKSLKKREIKDGSGTTWDFKRATVTFRVGFINVEDLKSKLQSRDFLICREKIICWVTQNI